MCLISAFQSLLIGDMAFSTPTPKCQDRKTLSVLRLEGSHEQSYSSVFHYLNHFKPLHSNEGLRVTNMS
jgi:hypothetical protein